MKKYLPWIVAAVAVASFIIQWNNYRNNKSCSCAEERAASKIG